MDDLQYKALDHEGLIFSLRDFHEEIVVRNYKELMVLFLKLARQ